MIIGVASAQIKLAKEYLASKNDNADYQQELDDLSGILLAQIEENMENLL